MLQLTEDAQRFLSLLRQSDPEFDLACLSLVSRRQLEVVMTLWNIGYASRCSFQDRRYIVSFFNSREGESVKDFLIRKSFASPSASFIPHVATDEAHEPNGLVLMPNGALAIFHDAEKQNTIYTKIEQVIERDALLDRLSVEYVGAVSFKPHVDQQCILSQLKSFEIFSPASDKDNVLVQTDATVCLLQWWHHYYAPSFVNAERACTMRVFSSSLPSFYNVLELLDEKDLVCTIPQDVQK